MQRNPMVSLLTFCLLCAAVPAGAAGSAVGKVLPVPACAAGWAIDGTVSRYDRDNLFDRIDGEAELYFPYGFEQLASARYVNGTTAFDADVYTMGSLLDAFGMFANYRKKDDAEVAIGAEGTVSESQLFFYQDRYLVRLQATGGTAPARDVFLACARAIARNLPPDAGRPKELQAFTIPAMERKSERYIASSLLGYDFFRRGLMADVQVNGEQVQLFLVTEDSPAAARTAFEQYRAYLKTAGKGMQVTERPDRTCLHAVDPLYGKVIVEQAGRFLVGAVRFADAAAVQKLVEQVRARVEGT